MHKNRKKNLNTSNKVQKSFYTFSAVHTNFSTHSTSLKNGPVYKNLFIPKTHDEFYVQNCTKTVFLKDSNLQTFN